MGLGVAGGGRARVSAAHGAVRRRSLHEVCKHNVFGYYKPGWPCIAAVVGMLIKSLIEFHIYFASFLGGLFMARKLLKK